MNININKEGYVTIECAEGLKIEISAKGSLTIDTPNRTWDCVIENGNLILDGWNLQKLIDYRLQNP